MNHVIYVTRSCEFVAVVVVVVVVTLSYKICKI
jgi:hypothetical protein